MNYSMLSEPKETITYYDIPDADYYKSSTALLIEDTYDIEQEM